YTIFRHGERVPNGRVEPFSVEILWTVASCFARGCHSERSLSYDRRSEESIISTGWILHPDKQRLPAGKSGFRMTKFVNKKGTVMRPCLLIK
ncbi:MAG: hypothetical protein NTV54_00435, partial [Ignavibacteriales bacterium]|nr:hypothetical protein [Ignavibacteriales bacterium]